MNQRHRWLMRGGLILALTAALALTGCTSKKERLEKESDYRQIGINAMEQEEYSKAIDAFNNALDQALGKIGPDEVDICFYKAAALYAAGDKENALGTYQALLEYDDENAQAYFLRGCVYLTDGDKKNAQADFKNVAKYAKDDEIYLEIYNSLNGAGYTKEATAYLQEALEKKSGSSVKNIIVKGRIYLILEDYENAKKQLLKAVDKGSSDANIYLAQVYQANGDEQKAQSCIDAYIKENKDSSVAYNALGCEKMEAGDYAKAQEYFKQGLALEHVTNEQELRSNLIAAYEYAGDFSSAKSEMETYIEDYPEDDKAQREWLFLKDR